MNLQDFNFPVVERPVYAGDGISDMAALEDLIKSGHEALEHQDYQTALVYFEEAVKADPKSTDARYGLGLTLGDLDLWEDAASAFCNITNLEPEEANGHFGLGLSYVKLEFWKEALKELLIVARLKPEETFTYIQLAFIYGELKNWQEAVKYHEIAVTHFPDCTDYHLALGIAYLNNGSEERARDIYSTLIKLDKEVAQEFIEMF